MNALGSNRDQLLGLAIADRQRLIDQDVLVGDPRRWRPRWFDGRFLAASDLRGEQNYLLVRQADLARAGGCGVVDGLMVSESKDATSGLPRIRIDAGHGVTDTGELVVLLDPLAVDPADVPEMQRLDAAFGLQVIPKEPGRTRNGLYVLALRPVEWTDSPIGAYPTSLTGPRTVEDSVIVEGVAVSLIPYPEACTDDTWNRRRARAAREVFVDGRNRGITSGVLPIAMVALRGNFVEWVDPFLVRRETGAERPAGMDFGFGDRPLREAHLLQYQNHLADALDATRGRAFAAAAYLDALPPVGQFPAAAIDAAGLTQRFFPAGIEVELSFVPDDEIPAIIEESLQLPPVDLTLGDDALEGTGVIVLLPLSRAEFTASRASLPNWDASLPRLRPVFLQMTARATPRDLLLSRVFATGRPIAAEDTDDAPWRELLRRAVSQKLLWYVRRRHLPIPSNIAGTAVAADSKATKDPAGLLRLLGEDTDLASRFEKLRAVKADEVQVLTRRLTESRFVSNPALLRTLVNNATGEGETEPTAESAVVALSAISDPDLGKGLAALSDASPALARSLGSAHVVESGALTEIDRLAREVPKEKFEELVPELRTAVRAESNVAESVAELRKRFKVTP